MLRPEDQQGPTSLEADLPDPGTSWKSRCASAEELLASLELLLP
jgi:hypothetical protein